MSRKCCFMAAKCEIWNINIIEAEVRDHVHMLVEIPPKMSAWFCDI